MNPLRRAVLTFVAALLVAAAVRLPAAAWASEDRLPLALHERAFAGDPLAQAELGFLFWQSNGDARTRVQSLDWYRRYMSSQPHHDVAERHAFPLACIWLTIGTPIEQRKASFMLLSLAEGEDLGAKVEVAKAYRYGLGFVANELEADRWAEKVANDILAGLPPSTRHRGDELKRIREDAERAFRAAFSDDSNCLPPDLDTAGRAHEIMARILGEGGVDFRTLRSRPESRAYRGSF